MQTFLYTHEVLPVSGSVVQSFDIGLGFVRGNLCVCVCVCVCVCGGGGGGGGG